jgi:hypothetical protein
MIPNMLPRNKASRQIAATTPLLHPTQQHRPQTTQAGANTIKQQHRLFAYNKSKHTVIMSYRLLHQPEDFRLPKQHPSKLPAPSTDNTATPPDPDNLHTPQPSQPPTKAGY